VFFPLFLEERAGEAATRDARDERRKAEGTIMAKEEKESEKRS